MSGWGYLLLGGIQGVIVTFIQGRLLLFFPDLSAWVLGPLVFFLTHTAGYLLINIFSYQYWWNYFRYFLPDSLLFIVLGLVAAGTREVSAHYIGERVMPAIPAVITYLLFLYLTQTEHHR